MLLVTHDLEEAEAMGDWSAPAADWMVSSK